MLHQDEDFDETLMVVPLMGIHRMRNITVCLMISTVPIKLVK